VSDELIYTSAPRGLRPGTSGFCTVAATATLGNVWRERLEALSGYKPLFAASSPHAGENPVAFSHTRVAVGGTTRSVLSRAASSGADHTGRTNHLVHHVVVDDRERVAAGPAGVMRQHLMRDRWDGGEPRTLPAPPPLPTAPARPGAALAWQAATGAAGWAGALASIAAADPEAIVYIVYPLGTDVLALFDEALRLLPETRRWNVTFNTYVTETPAGACAWRGIVADSAAVSLARGNVLELAALAAASPPDDAWTNAARTGQAPVAARVAQPAFAGAGVGSFDAFPDRTYTPRYDPFETPPAYTPADAAPRTGGVIPQNVRLDGPAPSGAGRAWLIAAAVIVPMLLVSVSAGVILMLLHHPITPAIIVPIVSHTTKETPVVPKTDPTFDDIANSAKQALTNAWSGMSDYLSDPAKEQGLRDFMDRAQKGPLPKAVKKPDTKPTNPPRAKPRESKLPHGSRATPKPTPNPQSPTAPHTPPPLPPATKPPPKPAAPSGDDGGPTVIDWTQTL